MNSNLQASHLDNSCDSLENDLCMHMEDLLYSMVLVKPEHSYLLRSHSCFLVLPSYEDDAILLPIGSELKYSKTKKKVLSNIQ